MIDDEHVIKTLEELHQQEFKNIKFCNIAKKKTNDYYTNKILSDKINKHRMRATNLTKALELIKVFKIIDKKNVDIYRLIELFKKKKSIIKCMEIYNNKPEHLSLTFEECEILINVFVSHCDAIFDGILY